MTDICMEQTVMNRVFIDTSAWIALMVANDHHHEKAALCFSELIRVAASFITTEYILDETITRIKYDVSHRKALKFLDVIKRAEESGHLSLHRIDDLLWNESVQIFRKYSDKMLSFTDCTSCAVAKKLKIDTIFAFDSDFLYMGFSLIPRPLK